MKVSELIKELEKLPQDVEVLSCLDDEGNGFREVPEGWVGLSNFYKEGSYYEAIHDDDLEDYEPEEVFKKVVIG